MNCNQLNYFSQRRYYKMMTCEAHCGITSSFRACCQSGSCYQQFDAIPSQTLCIGRGFANGNKRPMMAAAQTGSPYLSAHSTVTRMASYSSSNECFLRPFLTREEYLWCSNLGTWSNCTTSKNVVSPVAYQHGTSVRNFTGISTQSRLNSTGYPSFCNSGFDGYLCDQPACVPRSHAPKTSLSSEIQDKMTTNNPSHLSKSTVYKKSASECRLGKKEFTRASHSRECIYHQPRRHMETNTAKDTTKEIHTSTVVHKGSASKTMRRISEQYLCGDKSFDEMPPVCSLTVRQEAKSNKTRSTPLYNTTNKGYQHAEVNKSFSYAGKRKSCAKLENDIYLKNKRPRIDRTVPETNAVNTTIELTDAWRKYLDGSLSISSYRTGNKTTNRAQQMRKCHKDGKMDTTAVTSRPFGKEGLIRNNGGKSVELANKLPKAAKPILRQLVKNGDKRLLSGGYALDYDTLPKVVDVLPSNVATFISGSFSSIKE